MKVQHPTFPDVVQDVSDAEQWLKQGWLKSEQDVSEPAVDAAVSPKPKSRSRRRIPAPAKPTTGSPDGATEVVTATPDTKEASDGE